MRRATDEEDRCEGKEGGGDFHVFLAEGSIAEFHDRLHRQKSEGPGYDDLTGETAGVSAVRPATEATVASNSDASTGLDT